jgi:hypothetical protein
VHRLEQQEEARACELRAVLDRQSAGLGGDAAAAALIQEGLPPNSSQSAEPEPEPELEGLPTQVRKRRFFAPFYSKMIVLPRQARDKHKES